MTEPNTLKAISETDDELRVGNYIVLFGGRDLTGIAQGPNADGSQGEFFTKSTQLESDYTAIGRLPEDWQHGRDPDQHLPEGQAPAPGPDDILGYVDWETKAVDEKGVFVQRVLRKRNKYVQWLKELIDANLVGTSSEAVEGRVKVKANGEIEQWPLYRDALSITPMDWRNTKEFGGNVLSAVKALGLVPGERAGQPAPDGAHPKQTAQGVKSMNGVFELEGKYFVYAADDSGAAVGDPLAGPFDTPDEAKAAMEQFMNGQMPQGGNMPAGQMQPAPPPAQPKPVKAKQGVIMTQPNPNPNPPASGAVKSVDERLLEIETGQKAIMDKLNAPALPASTGSEPAQTRDKWPYKSMGEQLMDVRALAIRGGDTERADNRLRALGTAVKAILGGSESVPAEGGFLLQPTVTAEIIKPLHEEGPFTRAVRRLPVGPNSNSGWVNAVDETDRATGSRWGGVRGYRLAEGGSITSSLPKFRRIQWELKKYGALVYATDEQLADTAQFESIAREAVAEELMFMANDDIVNGEGTAGALGMLNSNALVSVTKETGQAAATVVNANLVKMWQRLHPRSRANSTWFINSEVEPQLDQLSIPVGTAVLEPRYVTYGPDGVMRIKGRPVAVTEFNAALGTVGDIILADMESYLFWERGGVDSETSIHVAFLTDQTAFRWVYRCDAKPAWESVMTPFKGSLTQSPFVALATRS